MKRIVMGRCGKPRGLRGDVYLIAYNRESPCWVPGTVFDLVVADAAVNQDVVTLKSQGTVTLRRLTRGAKGRHVASFDEISGREAAETMSQYALAVPLDAVSPAREGEFFFHEVPGWAVENPQGERIGTVVKAIHTHADLLEIRPSRGGDTIIIPIVPDFVQRIERERTTIVVDRFEEFEG